MAIGTYSIVVSIGGVTFNKQIQREADHPNVYSGISLPAAKSGTLSTRTSDTAGTLTMTAGHGLTDGQIIDIYWSGGVCYGATIGTVSTNSVPFTGASGDVLPAESTAITAAVQVVANTQIDGDAVQLFAILVESDNNSSTVLGHITLHDSSHAVIEEIDLTANEPYVLDVGGGAPNVLTGNPITHAHITQNSITTETITVSVLSLEDSTP